MTTTTSIEANLLNNPNIEDHPRLFSMLSDYLGALEDGYAPDPLLLEELLTTLGALEVEDAETQTLINDVRATLFCPDHEEVLFTSGISISGSDVNSAIFGDAENSVIYADAGFGEYSADHTFGNDCIDGGAGYDQVIGDGSRIDVLYLSVVINAGSDYIVDAELAFGDFSSVVLRSNEFLDDGASLICGNDTIIAGDESGQNFLVGDVASLVLEYQSEVIGGDDDIRGGASAERIIGDFSFVVQLNQLGLTGSVTTGDDRIEGGGGNDDIWGDIQTISSTSPGQIIYGADTFVFNPNSGNDVIHDFQIGLDEIDVSGYGAASLADLTITDDGTNTTIAFDGSNSVVLDDVIGISEDVFVFAMV